MGVVYEARDMNCRRTVAMKVLPHDLPCKTEDLLRFIEEERLSRLKMTRADALDLAKQFIAEHDSGV